LGLGGGRSATASGAPAGGGGAFANTYSVLNDGVDDYVGGAYAPSEIGNGAVTVSMWFKSTVAPASLSGTASFFYWGNPTSGSVNSIYNYWTSADTLVSNVGTGGYTWTSAGIVADKWYHYCLTRAGGGYFNTGKVYLNAADAASFHTGNTTSNPSNSNLAHASNIIRFGLFAGVDFPFPGYVDEVSIWEEEKDDAGVEALWNEGVPTDLTGSSNLLSWWRMGDSDSGTGTTVTDVQEVSNLSLVNGAAFAEVVPS
jgi:hypothetical protein